jgi:hypothetical protein
MKPGAYVTFNSRAEPPDVALFPKTAVIGFGPLVIHYWVPTPRAAELLASGRW